jgi:polysaccharide biosynthesis/export protein
MMRNKRHFVRVLATSSLLVLSSTTVPASQSQTQVPSFEYRIGPRDVLTVSLYGQDPKYSGDVTVQPDGKITLLLVDEIGALGLTPLELKKELTRAYAKYFEEPIILVRPKEIHSLKVFILGEVVRQGAYDLTASMSVSELIAHAGGFTPWANKEIMIIGKEPRPDGSVDKTPFNYKRALDPRSGLAIPLLRPGDEVHVR